MFNKTGKNMSTIDNQIKLSAMFNLHAQNQKVSKGAIPPTLQLFYTLLTHSAMFIVLQNYKKNVNQVQYNIYYLLFYKEKF